MWSFFSGIIPTYLGNNAISRHSTNQSRLTKRILHSKHQLFFPLHSSDWLELFISMMTCHEPIRVMGRCTSTDRNINSVTPTKSGAPCCLLADLSLEKSFRLLVIAECRKWAEKPFSDHGVQFYEISVPSSGPVCPILECDIRYNGAAICMMREVFFVHKIDCNRKDASQILS